MTIMVALVGEQTMPNFLPARYYHPDGILLIYTARTESKYKLLQATLQQEMKVYGFETDAYDIPLIAQALEKKLLDTSELVDQPLIFNLTGGTKAMSFAAYLVAQQRNAPVFYMESEGKRNRIYHYRWEKQQLAAITNELLPECVTLKDLFNVQLGYGKWEETGSPNTPGGRFEEVLAKSLLARQYEVMSGVKAMGSQIDIDVAIRWENRFGIIEAKTGNSGGNLNGIKQLSTAVRHLGTYTQTFYVINIERNALHDALTDASRIQVISLTHYVTDSDTLILDDAETFIAAIDQGLK